MMSEHAARIELALRNPYASRNEIGLFCSGARQRACRAVLVPGSRVMDAAHFLEESPVKTVAMIGFPFGSADSDVKRFETEAAIDNGAQELELVPSISRLKDAEYKLVLREIRDVVEAADERPVKVVIEAALWSDPQLSDISQMVLDSGAQFLSLTSAPLSADHVSLVAKLREMVGPKFGLKATAHHENAVAELIAAGANLVGLQFTESKATG